MKAKEGRLLLCAAHPKVFLHVRALFLERTQTRAGVPIHTVDRTTVEVQYNNLTLFPNTTLTHQKLLFYLFI